MDRRAFLAGAAALPFALRAGAALAGGTPVALVTADAEAQVVAVRLPDGHVLRRIHTHVAPRSIEIVGPGDSALVCHTAGAAVTILDAVRLRVRTVLTDFSEPRYAVSHPDLRHAYVTDSAASEVVAVNVVRGRTLGRLRVHGWARHLTIDPTGPTLWVGLGTASRRLALVNVSDPARPKLARYVEAPFGAHDVGWLPSDGGAWVTSGDSREMAIFGVDGKPRARLRAGAPPQHVTFGRGVAYVTSGADGTLDVHDLRTGRVVRRTAVPVGSYNVEHAGSYVLTPSIDRGTLCVLGDDGRPVRTEKIASSSHDACLAVI